MSSGKRFDGRDKVGLHEPGRGEELFLKQCSKAVGVLSVTTKRGTLKEPICGQGRREAAALGDTEEGLRAFLCGSLCDAFPVS